MLRLFLPQEAKFCCPFEPMQNGEKRTYKTSARSELANKMSSTSQKNSPDENKLCWKPKRCLRRLRPTKQQKPSLIKLGLFIGGEGEIRTHGGVAPSTVFKTAALNRSATSPTGDVKHHHIEYCFYTKVFQRSSNFFHIFNKTMGQHIFLAKLR